MEIMKHVINTMPLLFSDRITPMMKIRIEKILNIFDTDFN